MGDFLFQAMIYMAAAIVCVPIAKRIGLGSVLGYLIAGALIGPYIIGFVGDEGADIMHFAEFGVVMMLFLIGLELEPRKLWTIRRQILGIGMSQVMGSILIFFFIALALGIKWQASLAVSMALSMSSTAIVLQTCKERNELNTSLGKNSFSVLLFQDLAVIPILALLPLLMFANNVHVSDHVSFIDSYPAWVKGLAILLVVNAVILSGRYLIVPLLRIIAQTKLRELFVAAALLIVVSIAFLMQFVGLSPALGTFLAGVVLANSEFKHELESNLDPFKGLLLGLFFMAVGASFNLKLILEQPLMIIALTFAVVTVKFIVLWIIGKVFRFEVHINFSFAFILSQVGEFAFVILAMIAQLNILSKHNIDILVAVTASSMILTPLLLLLNDKLIQNRFPDTNKNEQKHDEINESNDVIIVGFSHFGSTLGRFLRANGVEATYIDYDSQRVDLLRKLGFKVYYGDATRRDFLESAGAEKAKILISAIGDADISCDLINTVQKYFPNLEIMARARNRMAAYKLLDFNITNIYREHTETSVKLGVDTLIKLGMRAYTATRSGTNFIKYDDKALYELYQHRSDTKKYLSVAIQQIQFQEEVLQSDIDHHPNVNDHAWDMDYDKDE